MPSPSRRRRHIPSTSLYSQKLSYLRYDRAKNIDRRSLLTSTTTITGPDQNRRHRIVSALSPHCLCSHAEPPAVSSESRALLAFPRLSLPVGCVGPTTQQSFEMRNSMMQCRTEDLKTSAQTAGIQRIVPSPWRRRRWILSISFCSRNKFRP